MKEVIIARCKAKAARLTNANKLPGDGIIFVLILENARGMDIKSAGVELDLSQIPFSVLAGECFCRKEAEVRLQLH